MKPTAEDLHEIDQKACQLLGMFRRRLRAHDMMPEDEIALAQVLDWVEKYVIMQPSMTPGEEA